MGYGRQLSLFDGSQDFHINKPIRLIELFAGYGSQSLALKYLGVAFEHWRISEWAVKSIQAYKDLHCGDDDTDYSKGLSKDEIYAYLYEKGISADYNQPMTYEQIKRLGEARARVIYNNIKAANNLVSVCNIKGEDLEIVDTDKYSYVLTYSFPCQDLSNCGKRKGMAKGGQTRSGLLWEVERILKECKAYNGNLPEVLLMENVPQVHGTKNVDSFNEWLNFLESIGYVNSWQDINATDFGVPQNRNRCFCVSILGDYIRYEFPKAIGCKLKLKDILEHNVPESYYLKEGTIIKLNEHKTRHEVQGHGFGWKPIDPETSGGETAHTIKTNGGWRNTDTFIKEHSFGIMTGTSEKYMAKHLMDRARSITTEGKNGVVE